MNVSGQVVRDLDWSKDGRILVTVSWDGMVRTYDMQLQQITTELLLFESDKELNYVSLSPEEDWLYVGSRKANLYRIPCKWPR
jgi:WD40 repeat protein